MSMVKFLHTTDWQLGMARHYLGHDAQARFSRIVIATGSASDCPLTLEVGDLSDITIPLLAGELNGLKFLGGEVALRRSG